MTSPSRSLGSGGQQGGRDPPVGSMLRQAVAQQNELQAAARAMFRDVGINVPKTHEFQRFSEHFSSEVLMDPSETKGIISVFPMDCLRSDITL